MRKHIKSAAAMLLMIGVLVSMFAFAPVAFAATVNGTEVELDAVISLTDHPDSFSEDYTVVLEAENENNPMPAGSSNGVYKKSRTDAGEIKLDAIKYSRPGIYKYTLSQQAGSADRWTYDSSVYNVIVYATNSEEGEGLDVNVAIYKEGEETKTDDVIFINEYDPLPVAVTIAATKTMDGKTPENGTFEFQLADESGVVIEIVSNTDSAVSFTDLVFDEEGTYTYTIKEIKGTNKDITYDTAKYTAIIEVYQDGDLAANVTYKRNGKAYDGNLPLFANVTGPVMGDNTNMGLLIAIFAASAVAIVLLLVFGKKRGKDKE